MAILGCARLSKMGINIKDLNFRHQLNPKNTGVTPIDKVIWYNSINSSIGIGNLLKINKDEQVYTAYRISAKGLRSFLVSKDTVMFCDCGMLSVRTGLKPPHRLITYNEHTKQLEPHAIISIDEVEVNDDVYTVSSDRKLLVMSNGVLVLSD